MGAPFVWFDLTTTDDGVRDFYTGLFDWPIIPAPGDYQGWLTDGEQPWAGFVPAGTVPAGRWIPYIPVGDLDTATKQAVTLGGSIVRDKTTGPAGTAVLIADLDGAVIALFSPAAG